MTRRHHTRARLIRLGAARGLMGLACCLAGCVVIPHPVPSSVERIDSVRVADDVLVSAAPRRLIERISERIQRGGREIQIVDAFAFRDVAFPDGGWRFGDLLTQERCRRIQESLDVQFLILLGPHASRGDRETGIMAPMGLPAGVMTARGTDVMSAIIVDLDEAELTCRLRSTAQGTGIMLLWVVFGAASLPLTSPAAERGLGDALAKAVLQATERRPVRVAVLGTQARGDPFAPYVGAPITTEHDAEVHELVRRLARIQADALAGRFDRSRLEDLLGAPLASHDGLGLDLYRLTAVAESETSPLVLGFGARSTVREERHYTGYLLAAFDAGGTLEGIGRTVIASAVAPPHVFENGDPERVAYDYVFPTAAEVNVGRFRLEVRQRPEGLGEKIYAGDALVYEDRRWHHGLEGRDSLRNEDGGMPDDDHEPKASRTPHE